MKEKLKNKKPKLALKKPRVKIFDSSPISKDVCVTKNSLKTSRLFGKKKKYKDDPLIN